MNLSNDILTTLWSQITNDPTTQIDFVDYDINSMKTLISFTCRNTVAFFIIKGPTFYETVAEIDKALAYHEASIFNISLHEAYPD